MRVGLSCRVFRPLQVLSADPGPLSRGPVGPGQEVRSREKDCVTTHGIHSYKLISACPDVALISAPLFSSRPCRQGPSVRSLPQAQFVVGAKRESPQDLFSAEADRRGQQHSLDPLQPCRCEQRRLTVESERLAPVFCCRRRITKNPTVAVAPVFMHRKDQEEKSQGQKQKSGAQAGGSGAAAAAAAAAQEIGRAHV